MSKKMEYEEFVARAKAFHSDKYTYSDKTRAFFNGSHSKVPIVCPVHGEFWQLAKAHLKYGCERCSYESRGISFKSNSDEFKEKARKIHGNRYDYSKVEYYDAFTKVCIICPKHGEFFQRPNDHLNGRGCPRCKNSHLENSLEIALNMGGIIYERSKHFDWLGRQELDFYIPSLNIGIECQGKQHIGLGGWNDRFDFQRLYDSDIRKQLLCNENNITLLYYIDKVFYSSFFEHSIYNESNVFYDKESLLDRLKKE